MQRFLLLWAFLASLLCVSLLGAARADDKSVPQSFDSKGVKIAYFEQGQGEPVVLIHGWLASAGLNWALPGISGQLAKDHRVIAMDVRGHGLSDKPEDEAAYGPNLVEDVVRLMDHLNIKKAHIVGYSMGGIIAGNFAANHPDRALSITLGGMGWLKDGSPGEAFFNQIARNEPHPDPKALCGRSLAKLALTEKQVKAIKLPVVVIVGDQDDMIKKLFVEPLQAVRKDWRVTEIKDANHLSCVAKPQFRDEISSWLNSKSEKAK